MKLLPREISLVLQAYAHYEQFHCPPVAGGLLDQTSSFIEAVQVIQSVCAEVEEERTKK